MLIKLVWSKPRLVLYKYSQLNWYRVQNVIVGWHYNDIFDQVLFALSGKDGKILWEFGNHAVQSDLMSVYAAQFVHDLNGDGCPEILAVHGGDELSDPGENKKNGNLSNKLV